MDINSYIQHPELLDRDTLYVLRSYVALYPCHQAARLLMLQNLYVLHDPTFDEELRQAAFFMTDRSVLYNLVEARYHNLTPEVSKAVPSGADLTDTLIDSFLDTVPKEEKPKRKPTPADATVDYVAYMLAKMDEEAKTLAREEAEERVEAENATTNIIDDFLENGGGRITISKERVQETDAPHNAVTLENDKDELEEGYYTETLAKIYIKQGNYLKALEIIKQLNLNNSKKSSYFVDQMRFLEKIISVKERKHIQ